MDKKERIMQDYFEGKIPTSKEATDKMYKYLEKDVYNSIVDYVKNHHLRFELSVAWDDDDEFEHEGYYDSTGELIERLIHYWEDIQK